MTRTVIYTAVMGGYNELQTRPDIDGVDFVAFVDRPTVSDYWDVRVVPPTDTPRRHAKRYKMLPHIVLPGRAHTIWVDGTVRIDSAAITDALNYASQSGFALWRHPERDDIYSEAVVSLGLPKYAQEPILSQVAHYWDAGLPLHSGLWACGILARIDSPTVRTLMEAWVVEVEEWAGEGQLAVL